MVQVDGKQIVQREAEGVSSCRVAAVLEFRVRNQTAHGGITNCVRAWTEKKIFREAKHKNKQKKEGIYTTHVE